MGAKTPESRSILSQLKTIFIGRPRDVGDQSIFHKLALIPFLAWVGLGADGLSSSAYGPEEAFKTLGEHTYLAVLLVLLMAFTILIISAAYSKIIEDFPHGGGGYVVASKLLGRRFGVVSGCALLVDYVLTITISIAAAGDALFSFLPPHWHSLKLAVAFVLILILMVLNLRGVKESVLFLTPVFVLFLITHVIAILGGIFGHLPEVASTVETLQTGFSRGSQTLGWGALLLLFVHAYSLGGGTYTGIEAVSNGLPIMREPKVQTAKRTMLYMGLSLAFTASGLLLCYLLWQVQPVAGKTLNAVFFEKLTASLPFGGWFVVTALLAEGCLLIVAAQAGFIDGPRVLANMAIDSWMPRRFSALSDRLTAGNGILLMGVASLAALAYTKGDVGQLVVMYSINVFLTFSLSIFGMLKRYWSERKSRPDWMRRVALFAVGFLLCIVILTITILEKFSQGGWLTLGITASLVMICFWIRAHYYRVVRLLGKLKVDLSDLRRTRTSELSALDANAATAVVLVGGYGGLGQHTIRCILKTFPGVYRNFVFASVGVIDSGVFKGEDAIGQLREATQATLDAYASLANSLGFAATTRIGIGTEVVEEGFQICSRVKNEFPNSTFFTGKVIFEREYWYQRFLHNETAFSLQKRLQLAGLTMVILPAQVG